ncbi:MAG TPA: DUF222 domain-containing protein, partial [Acidimicrobiales bacterium]|nr:DUF222 domain-containing protein [Acidimicrobiales bacterium]
MFEGVFQAEKLLADTVADLEAGVLTGDDATRLLRTFVHIERLAVAGKAKLARRIDESNVWRRSGHKSAATFLADQSGESLGQSIALLDTAEQLTSLPDTAHAFAHGELSLTQTKEIVSAAAANPAAEDRLLRQARHQPLHSLKQACRAVKNAAGSQEEDQARYRRVHQSRYWREWTEGGAVHGQYLLTPDAGAAAHAQIKTLANHYFQRARAEGRHEPPEAYAADAFVHLLTAAHDPTDPSATPPPATAPPAAATLGAAAGARSLNDPTREDTTATESPLSGTAGTADKDHGAIHGFGDSSRSTETPTDCRRAWGDAGD